MAAKQKQTCPCTDCPKKGDTYACAECGMSLVITKDCGCDDPGCVSLACCGAAMTKQ